MPLSRDQLVDLGAFNLLDLVKIGAEARQTYKDAKTAYRINNPAPVATAAPTVNVSAPATASSGSSWGKMGLVAVAGLGGFLLWRRLGRRKPARNPRRRRASGRRARRS